MLELSPGIRIQKSQGGGGSPAIRVFEANRVLIVVDGVRMNNAIYRSGHLQNSITVDPNNIDRVEIILSIVAVALLVCPVSISPWAAFGAAIRKFVKDRKVKIIIEFLLATLLALTAILIVIQV